MTKSFLEYAEAPESAGIVDIKERYGLFIDGEFVTPRSRNYFPSYNPATQEELFQVAVANEKDIDLAVEAARRALPSWQALSGVERGKYIYRIARLLQERSREFAVAESLDGGKVIRESRDIDVPLACAHFFYYAGWADKLRYAFPGYPNPQGVGVCAQVIPWNFPLLMAAWKLAPALACGNTVVLKPAETTSLTAMMLAEVLVDADLPQGVINIVTGAGQTGAYLSSHADVDKVAFTGSTEVGKILARTARPQGKELTLELGGKAANIVFEDAALDQAIEGIVQGIYFNQGHVCCAGSRLLVQETIHDEVVRKLEARISTLRLGDPLDKNSDIGAINSEDQLMKIRELVESGKVEGARYIEASCAIPERGYWHPPAFFTGVTQSMRIAREEIFGPVLSIITFRTPQEAVKKANNIAYGLSAGVWTENGSKMLDIATQLEGGVIWANTYNKFDPSAPFGGYKESGYGREGGLAGLKAYLKLGGAS